MSEMIMQEKKQETNREFEIYLQLQKGLQEQQPAQENLQNLFEIEDLLKRTDDEQLINTIYLHLTKQFHHFNQNVQYQIYLVFKTTAEWKYSKVFNKKEVLDMLQDHIRSLDQMTRTIAIKIVGLLTPFYLTSIETFHLIIDILLKSDYHEEINSSIHVLGNFVEGGSSNEFALRLLNKGDFILSKCGEGVYLDLLNRVKLHNRVIQINYYKQIIALICSSPASSLRKKLKLIIRACRSNYELAVDFFSFCEDNFDQFASEEPQFINKHVNSSSQANGEGNSSLSQTLIKLSAKSKSVGNSQSSNFNQKLKNLGKSLNQILEKKVKSAELEKRQSSVIEAIVLIYEQTKHFNVTPSLYLNEKIIKMIREYMLCNEDVDKSEFALSPAETFSNPTITSKSILVNIHNLAKSDERRRCLNILEMDDYDTKFVDKNFHHLQQVTLTLTTPNDAALLFKSFSNTFHKLSYQIISKNHENIQDFHEKHYAKFVCLLAYLSPLQCLQMYQTHIMQLLKDRIFKIYLPLFRFSLQCKYYSEFFSIVNLALCMLYNKLIDREELKRLISQEFVMNLKIQGKKVNHQEIKLLKMVASQFAIFNMYESSYSILSIIKGQILNTDNTINAMASSNSFSAENKNINLNLQSSTTSSGNIQSQKQGDQSGKDYDEERIDFQMKLLSLLQQIDKQEEQKTLLQLYDLLLFFSKESVHTFETQFMEFFCYYYQYLLDPTNNENLQAVQENIDALLSNKFIIDSSSKSTIRLIRKIVNCIDKNLSVLTQQPNKQQQPKSKFQYSSNMDEEENKVALQQLIYDLEQAFTDANSRYKSKLVEEEMEEENDDIEGSRNYQLDFYIDGRQNLIEKILVKPNHLLKILQHYPLILPRNLFVERKQQPNLLIQILPLIDYTVRAEKGLFLVGSIHMNNLGESLKKNQLQLKVDVKQDILPSECIYKHISTNISLINNQPTPKIFSEQSLRRKENKRGKENNRNIPFSTLVLFPHIGQFNITLSVDLICSLTGKILLTSFSQLVQITAQ